MNRRSQPATAELKSLYKWRFHREKEVKKDLASVRRMASSLSGLASKFAPALSSEQRLALANAQAALSLLSGGLKGTQKWAIDEDQAAHVSRESAQEAEYSAAASKRWPGGVPEMLIEAAELRAFAGAEGEAWAANARPGYRFITGFSDFRVNDFQRSDKQTRDWVLDTVLLSGAMTLPVRGKEIGQYWHAGRDDFEKFKASRGVVAGKANGVPPSS